MTNDVNCTTNVGTMKKMRKNSLSKPFEGLAKIEEPTLANNHLRKTSALKEFTYNDFKKIADKIPFTLAEWAMILHVSERTLQRYAKNNSSFAPINAERIALLETIIKEAKITFGKTENFYNWIKRNPYMLEGNLSIQSLSTFEGIQNVLTQLGRIQHGIFA
jgi:putative toxin-antitoxin system antitoxin component (TIGR02293 family)